MSGFAQILVPVDYSEPSNAALELAADITHGRTGIKQVLLGSVAEKTVRLAPCPVLTVRSGGEPAVRG